MSSAAGQPSAKAKPPRRHHLYLVFDDWCGGYSIRKVSLSPSSGRHHQQPAAVSGQEDEARSEAPVRPVRRLPPHLVRMVAPRSAPKYFVSAFGSRILAMHPPGDSVDLGDGSSESYFPMFGVRSRGITFGPWKQQGEHPWMIDAPIYLAVGKKLFTLSTASFEMLCLGHIIYPPASYCSMDRSLRWSWERLPRQPFKVDDVASYTLHADKRNFLISNKTDAAAAATFAFDTKALSWKLLGNWALPFAGRGHFVPHLRAFVGLSRDPDTLGQLYSCHVPSFDHAGDGRCPAPASRVCDEKLLSRDPAERHVSATLVDMRCDGEFCLVECVSIAADQALVEEGGRCAPTWSLFLSCGYILSHVWNEWRPDDSQEPTSAIRPSA